MARRVTTGEVGGAFGGLNITNTTIGAADNLDIVIDPSGTGILSVAGNQELTNASELRFGDSDNSHYVGFKSSGTVTTNRIWTLPAALPEPPVESPSLENRWLVAIPLDY